MSPAEAFFFFFYVSPTCPFFCCFVECKNSFLWFVFELLPHTWHVLGILLYYIKWIAVFRFIHLSSLLEGVFPLVVGGSFLGLAPLRLISSPHMEDSIMMSSISDVIYSYHFLISSVLYWAFFCFFFLAAGSDSGQDSCVHAEVN